MTLPRLYELERYWDLHPPVGDLVAAYMGFEADGGQGRPPHQAQKFGTLDDLIGDFTALGGTVN